MPNSDPSTDGLKPGLRLKLVPIVVTVLLAFVVPYLSAVCALLTHFLYTKEEPKGHELSWLYLQHAFQLLVALVAIAIIRRFVPADYGLHFPRGKTYYRPAVLWGLFFGVVMVLVDYAPNLYAGHAPDPGFPLNKTNVIGWLFFEGIFVGPTEEIPFRALLVTYLAATMPGRLRLGGFEMNWAGVLVAMLFALEHAFSFFDTPWPLALGQQIYAFALGILYAYWLEKSKSIVAPIVGHNVSDVTEYILVFILMALWK